MAASLALVINADASEEESSVEALNIIRGFVAYFDGTGSLEIRAQSVTGLLFEARQMLRLSERNRGLHLKN